MAKYRVTHVCGHETEYNTCHPLTCFERLQKPNQKEEIKMKKFQFNDKRGNRDRKCFFCVIYEGKAYTMKEAEDANLAVFRSLKYEQAGKWSNTTWEVTLNSASLIVFMEPFDGWSDKIEDVISEVKESCLRYIGYEPTDAEAILAFQFCCPGRYAARVEKDKKIANLI